MTAVEHVVQLLRDDPGWDVLALGQARSLLMDLSRESCQDPLLFAALCSQEAVRTEAWLERRRREPQQPPLLWEWPQPRLLDLLFATVAYARAWEDVLKVIDAISVAYKQRVDSPCLSLFGCTPGTLVQRQQQQQRQRQQQPWSPLVLAPKRSPPQPPSQPPAQPWWPVPPPLTQAQQMAISQDHWSAMLSNPQQVAAAQLIAQQLAASQPLGQQVAQQQLAAAQLVASYQQAAHPQQLAVVYPQQLVAHPQQLAVAPTQQLAVAPTQQLAPTTAAAPTKLVDEDTFLNDLDLLDDDETLLNVLAPLPGDVADTGTSPAKPVTPVEPAPPLDILSLAPELSMWAHRAAAKRQRTA